MSKQLFSFEGNFITLDQIKRIKKERLEAEKGASNGSGIEDGNTGEEEISEFDTLMESTAKDLKAICKEMKLDFKECKNKTDLCNLILEAGKADEGDKVDEKDPEDEKTDLDNIL